MIFHIVSLLIPVLLLTVLPTILSKILKRRVTVNGALIVAACLFFISWYLPSPLIDGQQTQFVTHFVGGGIFTGLVWIYLKEVFNWRPKYAIVNEMLSLYALVSFLGVANELFELTITRLGLVNMTLADTSWDLAANTLGALTVYVVYTLYRAFNAQRL